MELLNPFKTSHPPNEGCVHGCAAVSSTGKKVRMKSSARLANVPLIEYQN
jgi:hypothetical protein